MKMWPFLIAANNQIDYNFVVCPDVIASAKRWKIFETPEFNWRDADNNQLRVCLVPERSIGNLVFVFKVRTLRVHGQAVVDLAGRPIMMAYGFMARGSPTPEDASDYSALGAEIDLLPKRFDDIVRKFKDAGREWLPKSLPEEEVLVTRRSRRGGPLGKRTIIAGVGAMCVSLALNVVFYKKLSNSTETIETLKAEVTKIGKERDETIQRLKVEVTKIGKERDVVAEENKRLQGELRKLIEAGGKIEQLK